MSELLAFGDESGGHSNEDPGVFLLAACVIETGAVHDARAEMALLRPGHGRKLHWRDAGGRERARIVDTVVALPSQFHVVVRVAAGDSPERRRAKALEKLLLELEALNVANLVLESRAANQNRLDRNVLDGLRARRLVSTIRLDHAPGSDDPMLWVGDVVCGIVADHRIGWSVAFHEALAAQIVEHSAC